MSAKTAAKKPGAFSSQGQHFNAGLPATPLPPDV